MKKTVVEKHFDKVARDYDLGKHRYSYYYENLKKLLGSLIPQNSRVYEIGCGTGDLLISLRPKVGYGMDVSSQMIKKAKFKYGCKKNVTFSTIWPKERFDYIFMSDVIEHLDNTEEVFLKISKLMNKDSVFVNTMANPVWEPLLIIWEKLGLKMKEGPHNRIGNRELKIIMEKVRLKVIRHNYKLLIPIKIPLLTNFANKYLERYLNRFAFIEYFSAVKA